MKSRNLILIVALAVFAVWANGAVAEVYMKQVTHTAAMQRMGSSQPERFDTTRMWYSDEFARSDVGDTLTVLVGLESRQITLINHVRKNYMVLPLNIAEIADEAIEASGGDDAETKGAQEQAKAMMEQMMGSVKIDVAESADTKKIGDWNTRKFTVTISVMGMTIHQEIWATPDIDVDTRLYQAAANVMMSMMPGMSDLTKEMMKVKGVPVLTTVSGNMMGATLSSTTELLEFKDAPLPKGGFKVPEGYKEVDMGD